MEALKLESSLERFFSFSELIKGEKIELKKPNREDYTFSESTKFQQDKKNQYTIEIFFKFFSLEKCDLTQSLLLATSVFITEYAQIDKNDNYVLPEDITILVENFREMLKSSAITSDADLLEKTKSIRSDIVNHTQIPDSFKNDIKTSIEMNKDNRKDYRFENAWSDRKKTGMDFIKTKDKKRYIPLFKKNEGKAYGFIAMKIDDEPLEGEKLRKRKSINAKDTNLILIKESNEKDIIAEEIINIIYNKKIKSKLRKVDIGHTENYVFVAIKFVKNTLNFSPVLTYFSEEANGKEMLNIDKLLDNVDTYSLVRSAFLNLLSDNSDSHTNNLLIKKIDQKIEIFIIDPKYEQNIFNGNNTEEKNIRDEFFNAIGYKKLDKAKEIFCNFNVVTNHTLFNQDILPFSMSIKEKILSRITDQDSKL